MKHKKAFTLIELLVVVAIIALLISILLPSLARAREQAKRTVCAQNLKGVSTGCKMYAHDHNGQWPTVPTGGFGTTPKTQVLESMGGTSLLARNQESKAINLAEYTEHVSPTRALWQLVRMRQVGLKSFICPSSNEDQLEEDANVTEMYDFKGYGWLSYGYQVSILPKWNSAIPREKSDPRMVFLADKNPGIKRGMVEAYQTTAGPDTILPGFNSLTFWSEMDDPLQDPQYDLYDNNLHVDMPPELFLPFNSPNHGGRGAGEGQNVGRADGSIEFLNSPLAGVDNDNIYSATYGWFPNETIDEDLWTGFWPGLSPRSICPGFSTFNDPLRHSPTQTMLFP